MAKHKVIAWKYLPSRYPIGGTIVWWLFLDRLNAPGWVWGVVGVFVVTVWSATIWRVWHIEYVAPLQVEPTITASVEPAIIRGVMR